MAEHLTPKTLAGVWFLLVAAGIGVGEVFGIRPGLPTALLLTGAALVPPTIVLFVWRDSAPMTVAELLHDVEDRS